MQNIKGYIVLSTFISISYLFTVGMGPLEDN